MLLVALGSPAQNKTATSSAKSSTTTAKTSTTSKSGSSTTAKASSTTSKGSTASKSSTSASKSGSTASKPSSAASKSGSSTSKPSSAASKSGSSTSKSSSTTTKPSTQTKQATAGRQQSSSNKTTAKKDDSKKKEDSKKKDKDKKNPYDNKFRLAATGGLGLHAFQNGDGEHKVALQLKGGVNARMPVLLPDLYLMGEGRLALRTCGTHYTGQMSHLYLEVPVMAGYTIHLGDNFGLYAEAGPYVGLVLIKMKHEFGHHNCGFNPFDIGIGANLGVEMAKHLRLSLGFDYGFLSPCHSDHAHNGGIWLTGTYMF